MRKRGAGRGINDGRREGIPYYIIYRRAHPSPPWEGGRERGKRKTEPTQEARAEAKFILIMPSNKEEKTAKRD